MDYKKLSLIKHKEYLGKLEIKSKVPLNGMEDLSTYYTPGVAEPCLEISKDNSKAYDYTWKGNSVAVVSDGSAVLGLGNVGGIAGLPVMEGKAILFKEFGNVDTVPIVLSTQDPEKVIEVVEAISPTFGGINLEDIKAPECFYIEEKLKEKLNIPVFHDDQHGTAIVVLAGIINTLKITDRDIKSTKIVISGAGAAGIAIAKILKEYGANNIVILDSKGVIYKGREGLNKYKEEVAEYNINNVTGNLDDALVGTDVFVGVSQPNLLGAESVSKMNNKSIVMALSNPIPEIYPDEAKKGGAFIVATGRSDFPNQVNNLLAFPGIFRGVLDGRLSKIEMKHNIAAAKVLASYVDNPTPDNILPSVFEKDVVKLIAEAVKNA